MKKFEAPEMEVQSFRTEDIMVVSGEYREDEFPLA